MTATRRGSAAAVRRCGSMTAPSAPGGSAGSGPRRATSARWSRHRTGATGSGRTARRPTVGPSAGTSPTSPTTPSSGTAGSPTTKAAPGGSSSTSTPPARDEGTAVFDDFDAPQLDRAVWLPHYLAAWSSLAETRASYLIHDSRLELSIPPDQGLWCPDEHQPPLRVSGLQTGNFSGPAGSRIGQQPFRDGLVVREAQQEFRGCL